jgi:aconitate decarboxylase
MDAIAIIADHVVTSRFSDLPSEVIGAAKTFILDTFGVGLAGGSDPLAADLVATCAIWGHGQDARVWGSDTRLPAPSAAMCNATQVHNCEFDCLHEGAVVHAMSVVLPAAMAGAERKRNVSGADLIAAISVGVDVCACLGVAATRGLRFFRPATAGTFGGVAALGKLVGLDKAQMVNAFSIAYGQLCGTMQAHTEGSPLLAMQMGFSARNAVVACDLAARDFAGPQNVLEGPYGYFSLFEPGGSSAFVQDLGRRWFITELAHKPFPCGRASHGIIEACLHLWGRHGLAADLIQSAKARVPPLVYHLVGRPATQEMSSNYARLCAPYVAACALSRGKVGLADFRSLAFRDPHTQDLARRIAIEKAEANDTNALTPIEVQIYLRDGAQHTSKIDKVYGNPAKPLSRADHLAKFYNNCAAAAEPLARARADRLVACIDRLERVPDVAELVDLLAGLSAGIVH